MNREIAGGQVGFTITRDPDYVENDERRPKDTLPCVICGRAVTSSRARYVHLFFGDLVVTDEEANLIYDEEGDGGDLGHYPVGPDCLRKHPELRNYLVE